MHDDGAHPWPRLLDRKFADLNVSRETSTQLSAYVELLRRWNRTINLVSSRSIADVWQRHILDSAQLAQHIPEGVNTIVDLGSGGGLPGIVLACMCSARVHLIESDRRKAVFLSESVRKLDLNAQVHADRIEKLAMFKADVISARALAPVADLLDLSAPFMSQKTQCLFLKSQDVASELTATTKRWRFAAHQTPSVSDRRGVVLRITNVERR